MSKKAVLITFIVAIVLIGTVGFLSWWMAKNQPSADVALPPIPPVPQIVPSTKPYVPPRPMVCGDANRDGIVNALDINVIIGNWKQVAPRFNLVNSSKDQKGMINALDLSAVISHWGCLEGKAKCDCTDPNDGAVACPAIAISCTAPAIAIISGYDTNGCATYACSNSGKTPPPVPTMPPVKTVTATASPSQTATSGVTVSINKGETKEVSGYPFSIQYWRSAVSVYSLVIKPTATSGTCRVAYPIFYSSRPNKTYACNGTTYNISLDSAKSSSASVTVSVSKAAASSGGSSSSSSGSASSSYTRTPISQIRTAVPIKTRTSGSPSSGGSSSSN